VLLDHERAEELVELPEVAQADQLSVLEHEREHGVDPECGCASTGAACPSNASNAPAVAIGARVPIAILFRPAV
jgi:hypothetical protein